MKSNAQIAVIGGGVKIALGYIPAAPAKAPAGYEVEILGERGRPALLAMQALHDPERADATIVTVLTRLGIPQ